MISVFNIINLIIPLIFNTHLMTHRTQTTYTHLTYTSYMYSSWVVLYYTVILCDIVLYIMLYNFHLPVQDYVMAYNLIWLYIVTYHTVLIHITLYWPILYYLHTLSSHSIFIFTFYILFFSLSPVIVSIILWFVFLLLIWISLFIRWLVSVTHIITRLHSLYTDNYTHA